MRHQKGADLVLTVTYDPTRSAESGQYRVELVEVPTDGDRPGNRFGYWCDKGHLRHMAHAIFEPFRRDFIEAIINADPSFLAPPPGPKVVQVTWHENAVRRAL